MEAANETQNLSELEALMLNENTELKSN